MTQKEIVEKFLARIKAAQEAAKAQEIKEEAKEEVVVEPKKRGRKKKTESVE